MSKKIDLQLIMSTLSLIQNKEKWNIYNLVQKLNIEEKELFYILSVITDIYSQHGELLIDYEYDDKKQDILFNFNPSLKNIIQINDGELFNLIFLLSSNSIFKELVKISVAIEGTYVDTFEALLKKENFGYNGPMAKSRYEKLGLDEFIIVGPNTPVMKWVSKNKSMIIKLAKLPMPKITSGKYNIFWKIRQ